MGEGEGRIPEAIRSEEKESEEKKATNSSSLFPREEYEPVTSRLNKLKQSNPSKAKHDYRLLQKYEILEVTIKGTTVQKLQKKGTQLRFYCEECQLKKSSVRKCVVVKSIVSNSMNSRAQSQPDGKYRFISNYQDHLTKMICLRALQTKTAEEVAFHLVDIFCDKGAPSYSSV
ncbi:uncharacterized protein [Palaemon carinicauda]|uniref:uncharacterized protein n=1 Tax=Palaemon carinicauda TaxID=392227 RepID=UPI0035B66869